MNKNILIGLGVVALLACCYVFATNHSLHGHEEGHDDIPEGYHKMPDGTIMKNDADHGG
jgi:hypothetical protein